MKSLTALLTTSSSSLLPPLWVQRVRPPRPLSGLRGACGKRGQGGGAGAEKHTAGGHHDGTPLCISVSGGDLTPPIGRRAGGGPTSCAAPELRQRGGGRRRGGSLDERAGETSDVRELGCTARCELASEPLGHLPVRQAHRGEPGIEVRRDERKVVEADNREVVGNGDPQAYRLPEDAGCQGVVVAEDGGRTIRPVEETAGSGVDAVGSSPPVTRSDSSTASPASRRLWR